MVMKRLRRSDETGLKSRMIEDRTLLRPILLWAMSWRATGLRVAKALASVVNTEVEEILLPLIVCQSRDWR